MNKKILNSYLSVGGASIDAEFQEVLDFAQSNSISVPTTQQNLAYSQFLKDLDPNGIRSDAETINIYGFGSQDFGTLNLLNPTTFRHTIVGTGPTYTSGRGVKSPSNGNALNTNYKNNQYVGTENNLAFIVFVEESNNTAIAERVFGANILASSAATRLQLSPFSTGTSGSRFLNHLNQQLFDSSNHRGLYTMWPSGGNGLISKDGAVTTHTNTIVTPDLNNDQLFLSSNASTTNGGLTTDTTFKKNAMLLMRVKNMTLAREEQIRNAWIKFLKATRPIGTTWYVRPAGGSYGLEDGTSFANAWNGFADIDWTVFRLWDTLKVIGTHNEILTVGAPYINISGLYEGDTAIIEAASTRNRCIYNLNRSYVTIEDFVLQNPTTDGLGIFNGSWNVVVNRVTSTGSGNQAFQNETRCKVEYNDCVGSGCVDDGMSVHDGGVVTANNCTFQNNGQGVNAIGSAIYVSNDCVYQNNSVNNIQADVNSDFTINRGSSIDGGIFGNSTVAIKLNGVTRVNSNISGSVIDNP